MCTASARARASTTKKRDRPEGEAAAADPQSNPIVTAMYVLHDHIGGGVRRSCDFIAVASHTVSGRETLFRSVGGRRSTTCTYASGVSAPGGGTRLTRRRPAGLVPAPRTSARLPRERRGPPRVSPHRRLNQLQATNAVRKRRGGVAGAPRPFTGGPSPAAAAAAKTDYYFSNARFRGDKKNETLPASLDGQNDIAYRSDDFANIV